MNSENNNFKKPMSEQPFNTNPFITGTNPPVNNAEKEITTFEKPAEAPINPNMGMNSFNTSINNQNMPSFTNTTPVSSNMEGQMNPPVTEPRPVIEEPTNPNLGMNSFNTSINNQNTTSFTNTTPVSNNTEGQMNPPVTEPRPVIEEPTNPNLGMNSFNTPINNQAFNNMEPQMVTNPMNGFNGEPSVTSNMNNSYQQPMGTLPPKKNSIWIIIVIAILVLGGVGVAVYFLTRDEKKDIDNPNVYEESGENDNDSDPNDNDSSTISYAGYKFTKLSNYNYMEEDNKLKVYNSGLKALIDIVKYNISDMESEKVSIRDQMVKKLGPNFNIGIGLITTVEGKDVLNYTISTNTEKGIQYVLVAYVAKGEHTVGAYIGLKDGKLPGYTELKEFVEIIDNATYVGDYTNYSAEFSVPINKFDFEVKE